MLSYKIMGVIVATLLLSSTCFADGIKCRVTSYSASVAECGKSNGITASGEKVKPGMIAADWRVFSPGTLLYCNETRELWVVGDTGGAIHGTRIDRYVATHKEMKKYCGGKLSVSILYKPNSNRKIAHIAVHKGFILRKYVLNKKSEYTSRGGKVDRSKLIALLKNIPKTVKEQLNNDKSNVRKSNGFGNTKRKYKGNKPTIINKSVGIRDCSASELCFRTWSERQKSITTRLKSVVPCLYFDGVLLQLKVANAILDAT